MSAKARFIEPMLLLRTEKLPEGPNWLYELKFDGFRALAIKATDLGDGLCRWSVSLSSPDCPLTEVDEVIYTLDPTFTKPVRRVRAVESSFCVEDVTTCPFTIYAKVVLRDHREVFLEKSLKLAALGLASIDESHATDTDRPIILAVDDDKDVLRAVISDLRSRYAARYRLITAQSTAETLVLLAQLKAKEQELALVIADLRMPGGNGLDLLIGSRRFYPRAKRALLTAYADTDFAIRAVNTDINRYILKPWDPPEEILYPIIDEMLQDWRPSRSDLFVGESRLMSGSASRGSGDAKDI